MTDQSDGLSNFIELTASRFFQDSSFRVRLHAEADETPIEKTRRKRRELIESKEPAVTRRRTA